MFWTLGANQSGKAAIAAWRDVIIPGLLQNARLRLWPFEGELKALLQAGAIVMAETYPAEAMVQLGIRRAGSKRRWSDRIAYAPLPPHSPGASEGRPGSLARNVAAGMASDRMPQAKTASIAWSARLCVLAAVTGKREAEIPAAPWIKTWEGWVLGQKSPTPQP